MNYPGDYTALTRLNIEFTPTRDVKEALQEFTDDGNIDKLHILAGTEKAVYTDIFRFQENARSLGETRAGIHSIEGKLGKITHSLLLSDQIALLENQDGSGRLLIAPQDPDELADIVQLFDIYLPNEMGMKKLEKFMYVDFSSKSLTKNIKQRRTAADNFRRRTKDPVVRPVFYVDKPSLLRRDTQMPTGRLPRKPLGDVV